MPDDPGITAPGGEAPSPPALDSPEVEAGRSHGEGREARRAARAAERAVKRAAKAERKAAKQAAKAAGKAAKAERKATARAMRAADEAARKAARKATRSAEKAASEAAEHVRSQEPGTDAPEGPVVRERAERVAAAAQTVGTVLAEVAGLVRQVAEPAAARIVERVSERLAVEPVADHGSRGGSPVPAAEPSPEAAPPPPPEPSAAPSPEPTLEPESPPEPEAEGVVAPESEPTSSPERSPELAAQPAPSFRAGGEPASLAALEPDAEIGAAVDVGATSVHLLVAAVGGHRVEPLLDESVFLGLGDRVGTAGFLGTGPREELVAALTAYVDTARGLGAGRITLVGTDPLRGAADAASLVAAVEGRTGVALHVLTHDEEGMLTLLGVSGGRPVGHDLLVVDIGGGSTEIVVVGEGRVHASGLPIGAAQLTRDNVRADPPSAPEVEAMRAEARRRVVDAPDAHPTELVAVGGTASNLLRVLPATALDRILTRRRIAVALAMLAVESSEDAAVRHVVRPTRARILPAGALIVDAFLERYGAERMRVSEEGIREGAILAAARAGDAWRDRLPDLARGWN